MSSIDSGSHRRRLLINGRRVRITDLLEAGLLSPRQELYFRQYRDAEPYRAVVTERGRLRLADGREFATPSAATATAAKLRAVPGWAVWRVGGDGPTLHELRHRLLQDVAKDATPDEETSEIETEAVRKRFNHLDEARKKAEAGEPETLTVREFIWLWHLKERDRAASKQIDADLANHGLTTAPDYRAVSLDHTVRIITLPEPGDDDATSEELPVVQPEGTLAETVEEEEPRDIGLTLGNLLSNDAPLVSVPPTATFAEAITAMEINDYSQIAVLANPHTLHGAVSWKSIAQAKNVNPNATFSDAVDRDAGVFSYETRLLDVLDTLRQKEFIFVRDDARKISGIITATDVVNKYDETATPFFLIDEIDQELRHLIQSTFDEEAARQACAESGGLPFKSFDAMTMGQYQAVLGNEACWNQLGWNLDRKVFIERLNEIRELRNKVMHFNPDPIKPSDVDKLRNFLKLIRSYPR